MFNCQMTRGAIRNQVGQLVGFLIAFKPELAKWNNVMYVQMLTIFLFCDATSLAGVLVASAGIAALASPVLPIIGDVSTAPPWILGASNPPALCLPFSVTFRRAKSSLAILGMRQLNREDFAADFTRLGHAPATFDFSVPQIWPRSPRLGSGQIRPIALRIAKAATFISWALDCLAAFFTGYGRQFFNAKIGKELFFRDTGTRTICAGPTLAIPKLFTASRARGNDAVIILLTLPRAICIGLGRRSMKLDSTMLAS